MMYTIEYLSAAVSDMAEIAAYIGVKLSNPAAAERLAEEVVSAIEKLADMPYKCGVYTPVRALKHEYRKLLVQNYIVFYYIDEDENVVTVARVIYARRDYGTVLK
ncbi:MAG: type II toxin-antitoxin system RelE/ParE family toxin [Oscillospiraceae bacterium]